MKSFSALQKNNKKDISGLPTIRVAVLGDSSTQFLVQALRGEGFDNGLALQIWEADFNQVQLQVFDPSSELYAWQPGIVILFRSSHKLLQQYNKMNAADQHELANAEVDLVENISAVIQSRLKAKLIYYNYPEIDDAVFGNYANKTETSFLFQLRKLNYSLMLLAMRVADLHICDLSTLQNQVGKNNFFRPAIYINTEMVLDIDILPAVAAKTIAIISAMQGRIHKCLILDLDNTLWGGVIGDDGIENIQLGNLGIGKAFVEFQYWIQKLKRRGIIIVVCSKNTESVAKEPFEKHPDMVLQLSDIAVFSANWENKPDNIRKLQSVLNIRFDSMVFLDDNPFERNMVRENIPGITVPELPEDPAEFLEYLYGLNLFETVSLSKEDTTRTQLYQEAAQRSSTQFQFTNEDEFLQSLDMRSLVEPFNKYNTPRVAQLSQRSNQFNLRTNRYTDGDIERLASTQDLFTFTFTLEDKFGDNGLVCVIILKKINAETLFIEDWLMSCRVLKRGMEQFVLNTIATFAREKGFAHLEGEYLPTAKNEMVKDHYPALGFTGAGNRWLLDVREYKNRKCFINIK